MIKAACHIHSDWSYDGKWPLPRLAAELGRRGYRVLLMTEHDRGFSEARLLEYRNACAQASTEGVLVLPGIEYSDPENVVHILVLGRLPFFGEARSTSELLQEVKTADGIAIFAHPSRKEAWTKFLPEWASCLTGVEIWNRKTDGWAPSSDAVRLLKRTPLFPFVGMDFHSRRQFFPLTMELEIQASVTEESVLECLAQRRCRSSAFGLPLDQDKADGWRLAGLHAAERCRRSVAVARRHLFATD